MVEELRSRGITDERVLEAMEIVPRHFFVDSVFGEQAYADTALPIGKDQTISQPFTVAIQTQLLNLKPKMKVLEIGTGSGYQAAILSVMGMRVFSIEYDGNLLNKAARRLLNDLELSIQLYHGDGSLGWKKYQPFERILVTAASPSIPPALKNQLEIKGKMVIPVGDRKSQLMQVVTKTSSREFIITTLNEFKFVPLRGRYGFRDEEER